MPKLSWSRRPASDPCRASALRWLLPAVVLAVPAPGAGGIAGVCPDGSVFVVQRPEAIPCSDAKRVEPHEIPPLRPELLPRPYTWEVYQESSDPNNPYNLIDAADAVRALQQPPAPGASGANGPAGALPGQPAPSPPTGAGTSAIAPAALGLDEEQLRDLFLIVELSQDGTPASFRKETAGGDEAFSLALAYSGAFEAHVRRTHPAASGLGQAPVLLFSAVAVLPEPFHANLTFTQGHLAFVPEAADPRQFGLLQGRLGQLEAGEVVLGYVVLPERMDLRDPLGVYWNDRQLEVTFAP